MLEIVTKSLLVLKQNSKNFNGINELIQVWLDVLLDVTTYNQK